MVGITQMREIKPQIGFQEAFLSTPADIAIGGGAAGAGKTFALLLEPLRYYMNPKFGGVIFRRTGPQIRAEGGLWDTSKEIYPLVGGIPREASLEWIFQQKKSEKLIRGGKIKFSHLEYEKNIFDWQGSQIPFIAFDELTHFSEKMFFYLLSRNRSTCGIKPYVRATCNPDPDSWLANFLEWWIEQDDKNPNYGFPIPERAGKLRYFLKNADTIVWGSTRKEVIDQVPHIIEEILKASPDTNPEDLIKSVTFIPGDIYGNKELMRVNPAYLGNLLAQDEETQAQLLKGNWKIRTNRDEMINFIKCKDAFTNDFVKTEKKRYITADIALKGSDLLIVGVWEGFRLIDIGIMEKSKGNQVIDLIKELAYKWNVPQSHILYDDDGVGQFIDGFIQNANAFKNGGSPIPEIINGKKIEPNYKYLRDQCFFKLADRVNNDGYYISPEVANKVVKGKTVREHIMEERRSIKRDKPDYDGKLAVIPKHMRKAIIGHSTDFMDMWMMREWFELQPNTGWTASQIANYL
jgi:hypothetical protein